MNPILVLFGAFVMIVFIVWFETRQKQTRVQARTELHKHLLDKFGSGTELGQFLETEGGKKMIEDLGTDRVSPKERALKHVVAGTVLTCLGAGFLILMYKEPDLVIPGGILVALGSGFLIAAFVSLRLSKSWAADDDPSKPGGQTDAGSQSLGGSSITCPPDDDAPGHLGSSMGSGHAHGFRPGGVAWSQPR